MSMVLRPLAVVPILLLAACATPGPRSATGPIDDAAVNRIEAQVAQATADFDAALARYRAGEPETALAAMANARGRVQQAATTCAQTVGCELSRIVAAQDVMLERQTEELLAPSGEDRPGATEDAPRVIGEGRGAPGPGSVAAWMPESTRTVQLLNGRSLRDAIEMNGPVQAAIEEWLTWLRPSLLDAYEHYQFMRYRMYPAYEEAGLPEALLFGILAKESGGRVHAVSRAGASGPLQFMPATGQRFGLGREADGFDTRFDPGASARANAAYLNEQFRQLNNDLALVLAAYNGGEGRVGRLSQGGQRAFWSPAVFDALPEETRNYVPMVLAAAWLFLHGEDYGLEWPRIDARPAHVVLTESKSLNEVAVCLGQDGNPRGWFRTLRNLNPRWEAETRLPVGTRLEMPETARQAFERHCVSSPRRELARRLADAQPAPRRVASRPASAPAPRATASGSGADYHVVRRGETLHSISKRERCTGTAPIARANGLKGPAYTIRVGQRLTIPRPCR
jgi:membrane-bound lytic murein transglycosylase D